MKIYPHMISCDEAGTLAGLFQLRTERSPEATAYLQYDPFEKSWKRHSWKRMRHEVSRWRLAMKSIGFEPGDRVAVLLRNCVEWVCFEQAALSLGLVVVPLYTWDNPESIAYILRDSGSRLLLLDTPEQWNALAGLRQSLPDLSHVLCLEKGCGQPDQGGIIFAYTSEWLPDKLGPAENDVHDPDALASIVYTSGTTGRPKGVMLTHRNILWNAEAVLKAVPGFREDVFLSFLPLSHTFERTAGYYVPMMAGSSVAYARSVKELGDDLITIRPTVLISVPRIYERVYGRIRNRLKEKGRIGRALFNMTVETGWRRFEAAQGRGRRTLVDRLVWAGLRRLIADRVLDRLGGRVRLAVSGGAPLHERVSRFFVGLGLPLLQGYGLTEAAPVVSTNTLENNVPSSVGEPLPGVEVMLGSEYELLVRSPAVMPGYWNRPEDTREALDADGWLHTGDVADMEGRRIFIRGRLKDIIVMSTGEKISPVDIELSILQDPLFDQAMVVGEARPCLAALVVLRPSAWARLAGKLRLDADDPFSLTSQEAEAAVLSTLNGLLRGFPSYARIRSVYMTLKPWTIEDGLVTATMKLKRREIEKRFADEIRKLYAGHDIPEN